MKLSAVLITLNEARRLEDCLRSVDFADEIIIVDSGSTDATADIAALFKARFVTRPLDHFAGQKNYALSLAQGEWLLQIDADERVSPELRGQILQILHAPKAEEAYRIHRLNHIFGKPLRHGSNGGDYPLRLIRRGYGTFEGLVHEAIKPRGRTGCLQGPLIHYSTPSLDAYFSKFDLYTGLDARQTLTQKGRPSLVHLLAAPPARFLYFGIFRLGFLDGWRGLLFELLSAYYLFIKGVKARRLARQGASEKTS